MADQQLTIPISNQHPADELASVRETIRVLRNRESELRAFLLANPADRRGCSFIASVLVQEQKRLNQTALKKDHPDLAEKYIAVSSATFVELSELTPEGQIIPKKVPPWLRKQSIG